MENTKIKMKKLAQMTTSVHKDVIMSEKEHKKTFSVNVSHQKRQLKNAYEA